MRVEVMNLCNDIPTSGHQGDTRTFGRIREKFYWYSMSTDIHNYIASCAVCNRNKKTTKHARCSMTKFHAGEPMEGTSSFLGAVAHYSKKKIIYINDGRSIYQMG